MEQFFTTLGTAIASQGILAMVLVAGLILLYKALVIPKSEVERREAALERIIEIYKQEAKEEKERADKWEVTATDAITALKTLTPKEAPRSTTRRSGT